MLNLFGLTKKNLEIGLIPLHYSLAPEKFNPDCFKTINEMFPNAVSLKKYAKLYSYRTVAHLGCLPEYVLKKLFDLDFSNEPVLVAENIKKIKFLHTQNPFSYTQFNTKSERRMFNRGVYYNPAFVLNHLASLKPNERMGWLVPRMLVRTPERYKLLLVQFITWSYNNLHLLDKNSYIVNFIKTFDGSLDLVIQLILQDLWNPLEIIQQAIPLTGNTTVLVTNYGFSQEDSLKIVYYIYRWSVETQLKNYDRFMSNTSHFLKKNLFRIESYADFTLFGYVFEDFRIYYIFTDCLRCRFNSYTKTLYFSVKFCSGIIVADPSDLTEYNKIIASITDIIKTILELYFSEQKQNLQVGLNVKIVSVSIKEKELPKKITRKHEKMEFRFRCTPGFDNTVPDEISAEKHLPLIFSTHSISSMFIHSDKFKNIILNNFVNSFTSTAYGPSNLILSMEFPVYGLDPKTIINLPNLNAATQSLSLAQLPDDFFSYFFQHSNLLEPSLQNFYNNAHGTLNLSKNPSIAKINRFF
jgi:hypothetical protein